MSSTPSIKVDTVTPSIVIDPLQNQGVVPNIGVEAQTVTPRFSGIADVYGSAPRGLFRSLGPGFFMYITYMI